MLKAFASLGFILTIFSSVPTFAYYGTLANSRSRLSFPKYDLAKRKIVINQARIALTEIFVHMDVKKKDFGLSVDPAPKLNALGKKIATISDNDFHKEMSGIFQGLRDLHTYYTLPAPLSCYESFLPVLFKQVNIGEGKKVFAVTDYSERKEILDLLPKPFNVALGDTVLTYNGKPILDAVKAEMKVGYGANEEAAFRNAQDDLRYKAHGMDHLPKTNTVDLELQNAQGKRYKLKLPWVVYADDSCVTPPPAVKQKKKKKSKRTSDIKGETEEPILYWKTNSPGFGVFGYLQLTSFNPVNFSNDETVIIIRDLLLNELKDTDGLVIDLRDNLGGQVPFAEKIIQLLTPNEITPINYILKNSEANYVYMTKSDIEDPFTELLKIARNLGRPFTTEYPISVKADINDLGQAYFKPVAVFVNSKCYSSCEVFAAQIQDHNAGIVFGEDSRTGGGGANVYNFNDLLSEKFAQTDPAPFEKLPGSQNIHFSFRQTLRVGKSAGVLIENQGVKADRLSPMARTDIFNATNDQLLVLQRYLAQMSPLYTSKMVFKSEDRFDLQQNGTSLIEADWENTSLIEFKQNGKSLETREVELNSTSGLSLPIDSSQISQGRVEMLGANNGKLVWRKIVNYRVVPNHKLLTSTTNLLDQFSFFSVMSTKENGWQRKGDELVVGNGVNYQNHTESEASVFVTLPVAPSILNFDAKVDLEKDFDFLKVVAIVDGIKIDLMNPLTGHLPESKYQVDLTSFAGKNVEIRFSFKSDEGTKDKGVTLKNISLEI